MLSKFIKISCLCFGLTSINLLAELSEYEKLLVRSMPIYARLAPEIQASIERLPGYDHSEKVVLYETSLNPLFEAYPALRGQLSYVSLGDFPTPVVYCKAISAYFPTTNLYVKHDGVTGKIGPDGNRMFGGNKLRKLQYLLADALAHGHDTIMTFGCVGSNHALQTAICSKNLGLSCICMLMPQPNARVVQRNLLLQKSYGAELIFAENVMARAHAAIDVCHAYKAQHGMLPYIIRTGASVGRGAIGYVEAAFELREQIRAGLVPQPDHIYVTCGSAGTAAGLLLGCAAAGIKTMFHLVLDEPGNKEVVNRTLHQLIKDAQDLLRSYDPTFPCYQVSENDYEIIDGYCGEHYGQFTSEGVEAVRIMRAMEGLQLDGIYSGKCFSALLADLKTTKLHNATVLFWNTFCGEDMSAITATIDYRNLPEVLHRWFTEPVQPLDVD
jgi:1-aminocyclopropane-1-carboxylate deaminase/D-cysteine desulfhydrase-like pyridoxal-dependent ACC family enzyme